VYVARKKQWHPVFAELLRPVVESHYELETNVSVSDVPRQADFVLLRRRRAGLLPAASLWSNLTTWNVLEFKGPTVSPRIEDHSLLVELGLGIHHRLNEEKAKRRARTLGPEETALWYLANRLGRRLLHVWEWRLRELRLQRPGIWRSTVLGHPLFLVSGNDLPVEEASLPLHLVAREGAETEQAMARLMVRRPGLWKHYGGWLAALHPAAYEEVLSMARQTRQALRLDLTPIIESMGIDWVIEQLGPKRIVEELGARRVIDELGGVRQLWAKLTPEERRELKRLQEE
jgi:hypothetical protein